MVSSSPRGHVPVLKAISWLCPVQPASVARPATRTAKHAKDLSQTTVVFAKGIISQPSLGSVPVKTANTRTAITPTSYARTATQLAKPVPARIQLSALPAQADAKPSIANVPVPMASTIAVVPPTSNVLPATQAA